MIGAFLSHYGHVERTEFHNVLVVSAADVAAFLEAISAAAELDVSMRNDISRIMPAQACSASEPPRNSSRMRAR